VIVVDASALLEILLETDAGSSIERRVCSSPTLHAPHLIDLEVAHVLRRYEAAGALTARRAREALYDFADFSIERYPHELFLPRIWDLRHNVTAYDATYIALAEALDAPLVTMDRRLMSVPGHGAVIECLERT
jgi:predicted nucleic acid-binding protein